MSYEDDGGNEKDEKAEKAEAMDDEEKLKNDRIAMISSMGSQVSVDDEEDKALAVSQGLRPDPVFGTSRTFL
jgi:hypothetical protein